jgi:hypothetical protein
MLVLAQRLLDESKQSERRAERQNLYQEGMKLLQTMITTRQDSFWAREAQRLREKENLPLE